MVRVCTILRRVVSFCKRYVFLHLEFQVQGFRVILENNSLTNVKQYTNIFLQLLSQHHSKYNHGHGVFTSFLNIWHLTKTENTEELINWHLLFCTVPTSVNWTLCWFKVYTHFCGALIMRFLDNWKLDKATIQENDWLYLQNSENVQRNPYSGKVVISTLVKHLLGLGQCFTQCYILHSFGTLVLFTHLFT